MTKQNTEELEEEHNERVERAKAVGTRIGVTIGSGIISLVVLLSTIPSAIISGVFGRLPKRTGIYRWMIKTGYSELQDKTSGHFVVDVVYGDGEVVPRPATLDSETQIVETNNGEKWSAPNGVQTVHLGDGRVATGIVDQHELYSPVAARIAECKDISSRRQTPVRQTPEGIEPVQMQSNANANTAIADGGQNAGVAPLPLSRTFNDVWIDISNPEEDADGMIVSMEKAYDLHWDRAASEEMENQEQRGRLAEVDPSKRNSLMWKIVLLALGAVALGLFGPSLAAQLAGSGGDAATGISMMLGWV